MLHHLTIHDHEIYLNEFFEYWNIFARIYDFKRHADNEKNFSLISWMFRDADCFQKEGILHEKLTTFEES